jgi:hypothetical protein
MVLMWVALLVAWKVDLQVDLWVMKMAGGSVVSMVGS